jgi:hypothetical protein
MIGGTDITIRMRAGVPALDCALRIINLFWRDAVFQDGQHESAAVQYQGLGFSGLSEVLAYRSREDCDRWREAGADTSLDGTMIHIILRSDELTFVLDSKPGEEMLKIVGAIRTALQARGSKNILWHGAEAA